MPRQSYSTGQSYRLFEQVYDHIENRIRRGDWKEHEKLPSIRQLAQELQVHRLTVFRAYRLLVEQGKVYVKDKSGYFLQPSGSQMPEAVDALVPAYETVNHLSEIHRIPVAYQLSEAIIDPNLLPNMYLTDYVKRVFDLYPKVLATYSPVQGDEELREALCRYFTKRHLFHLTPDEILITSGAQQAINLIARILVKPMDTILLERPTYSVAYDIFRQQGAQIIPVDIHPDGYNLEQVEGCMRRYKPRLFYMNPTFHNPTGYTVPVEQRKKLVELAERYRCLLVDDDTCYDIYFDREPPPPLFTYDTEGCVIYIRGFSKYVSPGLRVAAVMSRPPLMKPLLTAKSLSDNGSPLLNQKMFLHYFTSDRLQQHLKKLRIALQIRKEIVEEELAATDWQWISPQGGLNLWVRLSGGLSAEKLLAASMRQSISFVPGIICDPKRELTSWARVSYSYANEPQLREGMRKLIALAGSMDSWSINRGGGRSKAGGKA
ncbi:PLP-dependent aminotransferase family protein [Paenibacillus sp. tmac-D7]|uniref:aminotransferase-like domain-containing protein n=1 Tax=Paenibacillus sp. tmac-D7 TaxID=2591462 RepID=UPI001144D56D|nr:PLP-dependent aminotransferase family protein [Paenibacillus sp. tmac-D7]